MIKTKKVGFIGAGQMCEAILSGGLRGEALAAENVTVCDVSAPRLAELAERYSVATLPNGADGAGAAELARGCDVVVLSVKPQVLREVLCAAAGGFGPGTVVLSIVGGVTLATLATLLPNSPLVRAMPNTPMLVGAGSCGVAPGPGASEEQLALCLELLEASACCHVLGEAQMDALTAVSGCGPAYAYLFMEALADGGVEQGLPRELAQRLAAETLAGAAIMVMETKAHPAQLKDAVCSPGGGTVAGVHALERGAFRAALMDAVRAAKKRMEELGG